MVDEEEENPFRVWDEEDEGLDKEEIIQEYKEKGIKPPYADVMDIDFDKIDVEEY